jgi:hypothetical protein
MAAPLGFSEAWRRCPRRSSSSKMFLLHGSGFGARRACHRRKLCSPMPTAFAAAANEYFSLTTRRTASYLNSSENTRRFPDVSDLEWTSSCGSPWEPLSGPAGIRESWVIAIVEPDGIRLGIAECAAPSVVLTSSACRTRVGPKQATRRPRDSIVKRSYALKGSNHLAYFSNKSGHECECAICVPTPDTNWPKRRRHGRHLGRK